MGTEAPFYALPLQSTMSGSNGDTKGSTVRTLSSSLSCLASISSPREVLQSPFTTESGITAIEPTAVKLLSGSVPFMDFDGSIGFTFDKEDWGSPTSAADGAKQSPTMSPPTETATSIEKNSTFDESGHTLQSAVVDHAENVGSKNEHLDEANAKTKSRTKRKKTKYRARDNGLDNTKSSIYDTKSGKQKTNESKQVPTGNSLGRRKDQMGTVRPTRTRSRSRSRGRRHEKGEKNQSNDNLPNPRMARSRRRASLHGHIQHRSSDHLIPSDEANKDSEFSRVPLMETKSSQSGIARARCQRDRSKSRDRRHQKSNSSDCLLTPRRKLPETENARSSPTTPVLSSSRSRLSLNLSKSLTPSAADRESEPSSPTKSRSKISGKSMMLSPRREPRSLSRSAAKLSANPPEQLLPVKGRKKANAGGRTASRALPSQHHKGSTLDRMGSGDLGQKLQIAGITVEQYRRITEMGLTVRKGAARRESVI